MRKSPGIFGELLGSFANKMSDAVDREEAQKPLPEKYKKKGALWDEVEDITLKRKFGKDVVGRAKNIEVEE